MLPGFENLYYIYENGDVYSIRKQRFLKPQLNSCGYILYHLTQEKTEENRDKPRTKIFFAHRLVLITFKGYSDNKYKKEVNHIDHDKLNNHISNLEWVTHSENILKSFQTGQRNSYWKGKIKPPHNLETRIKMSNAKKKPILTTHIQTREQLQFDSVVDAAKHFGVDRKTINRYLKDETRHKAYIFEFKPDVL